LYRTESFYSFNTPKSPSMIPGRFSTISSTTASGPRLTCRPCGRAYVLMPGFTSSAAFLAPRDSSGLHMEAVKRISGWSSSTAFLIPEGSGATICQYTVCKNRVCSGALCNAGRDKLAFHIPRMNDRVFVFDFLHHASDQSLGSFRGIVDRDQLIWAERCHYGNRSWRFLLREFLCD